MTTWKEWVQDHILTGAGLVIVTVVGLAASHWIGIVAVYPILVGGVLTLCGVKQGMDVAYAHLVPNPDTTTVVTHQQDPVTQATTDVVATVSDTKKE